MGGDEVRRPPQWADVLLRTCLNPEEAETESGDLLEAYRDSIYPTRGRWRADLWYVLQVAGYLLRARGMELRNWLLAGLALSVFTIVATVLMYPGLLAGPNAVIAAAGFLIYGYAAICRTRPGTPEDAVVLRLGTKYGIASGALWMVGIIGANLGVGISLFLALFSYVLPLVAGAHGGIKLWRVCAGMRVGFWCGLISGLIVFLGFMAFGYVLAFVPGLPGAEIPRNPDYTALEYQRVNVSDTLGGGIVHLFLFGGIPSVIVGAVGGLAGILLVRTGRGPDEPRRIFWSLLAFCMLGSAMLN